MTQYVLVDPLSINHNGPDIPLPKSVTLRRGDAAAIAAIGPLTKTRCRTKTGSQLHRSDCMVLALSRRGTIVSPLVSIKQSSSYDHLSITLSETP